MKWEYLVMYIGTESKKQAQVLNSLGEEGWELVAIDSDDSYAYLKRPKS